MLTAQICKWHFARIHLRRSIILRKDELTYEAVLELDRECRDSVGPIAAAKPGEATPWLRAAIVSALHNRCALDHGNAADSAASSICTARSPHAPSRSPVRAISARST